MIYLFLAEGFEECEALAPLDILRRAEIEIKTVGIGGKRIIGSHGIEITADLSEEEVRLDSSLIGIILPGGMPGTLNLENSSTVQKSVDYCAENSLMLSAICAAPLILGHKNLLKGKKATCFTGFEKELYDAECLDNPVVCDGNIITGYGAGAAFDFGFKILEYLKNKETADTLSLQMRYTK